MDFDHMYNARIVLDKRTFSSRLDLLRTQNTALNNSTETTADEELVKAVMDTVGCVENLTTGRVPLRPGMLFWIATHRGCYFWIRSAFQLTAFSLLIVTLIMLNEFRSPFWYWTVSTLVAIHSIDMVSFSLDLISFTTRNVKLLYYKFGLDVISFSLALFI